MAAVDPEFIELIAAHLAYWQRRTAGLRDESLAEIDDDRHGLWKTLSFGLACPQLAVEAAGVAHQSFLLAERRGYGAEWLPLLRQAMQSPISSDLRARLLNQTGIFYRDLDQPTEAIECHQQALTLACQLQDLALEAETLYLLGNAHRSNGQPAMACRYGLEALERLNQLPSPSLRQSGSTHNLLGLAWLDSGDLGAAERHFQKAIQTWRELQDWTYLGSSLINLGLAYQYGDKLELALDHYAQALKTLESSHSERPRVFAQLNQAALHNSLKQFEAAERVLRRVHFAYLKRAGERRLQAMVYNNLGVALAGQGRAEEALLALESALKDWQLLGDELNQGNTLGEKGRMLVNLGQEAAGRALLEQGISLLEKHQTNEWARITLEEFQTFYDQLPPSAII